MQQNKRTESKTGWVVDNASTGEILCLNFDGDWRPWVFSHKVGAERHRRKHQGGVLLRVRHATKEENETFRGTELYLWREQNRGKEP